ncbi:MAG: NAD-dependent epimerase/dehydratase family protein [Lentimicrobium sp.]|nr:NAD-dependent epimerase/dehydratase family protein [Lentimicrobium sp.]
MKILITGADGMLGSNLTRLLLARGHEVSALIHPTSKAKTLEGLDIKRFTGDLLQPETLISPMKGQDVVIHAAASTRIWPPRSETIRKINVEGTLNIIEAVLQHKISRLVFIGSGSSVNAKPDASGKSSFPGSKYGLDYIDTKHQALSMVMEAVKNRNLPALAILPSFMIGPYDSLPGSGKMILAAAKGKLKFYTGGGRNFIHVNDVATAIANSLDYGKVGKCYLACNENLSYQEFLAKVSGIVGIPEPRLRIPDFLVKFSGLIGSGYGYMFRREPLLSYPMARISCDNQFMTDDGSREELKITKTDIEIAIKECYQWFLENNYLKKVNV